VEGRVLTPSGAIVVGAVVQIKDAKTLQIRSFITQGDGRYRFYGLNSNSDYELTAEKNGSTSGTKTISMFDNRTKVVFDIRMKKNPG
jgi:Carboxypeptidase regulatory-like domain